MGFSHFSLLFGDFFTFLKKWNHIHYCRLVLIFEGFLARHLDSIQELERWKMGRFMMLITYAGEQVHQYLYWFLDSV